MPWRIAAFKAGYDKSCSDRTVPYNTPFWKKLASERKRAYKWCAARIDPLGADD
jgi:hypothetical protein